MAFTLTSRNFSEGTYSAGANVGDTFTPAENDIIVVFNVANDATAHTTVTGWGATWTQILAPSGTLNYSIWAARMGASPGSSQANIDFGGGSINYCAGVIQIAGAHTTAAIGVGGSNLFRQVTPLTTYDPASPYSATALSAFASATNLALTLAGISANLPLAPKAGFTELLEASGGTYNPNVYASYKTSSDTSHQVSEATAGDFDFKNVAIVAIEMLEASAAGTTVTPTVGTLSLAGVAPAVTQSAMLTPLVGALSFSGVAATVISGAWRVPTIGSLAFTGVAPYVLDHISPAVGALSFSGIAALVGQGVVRVPTVGSLTLTGLVPTVSMPSTISPTVGALTMSGQQPAMELGVPSPLTGSIVFSGLAASVLGGVGRTPSVGSLALTGNTPAVTQQTSRTPSVGSLALTGLAPTVTAMGSLVPSAGSLSLSGIAPAVTQQLYRLTEVGSLVMTGLQPGISANGDVSMAPTVGELTLMGNTVVIGGATTMAPAAGSLSFLGGQAALTRQDTITPGVGSAVLVGAAPILGVSALVTPAAGSLVLLGGMPLLTFGILTPSVGSLTFNGAMPSVNEANPNTSINGFGPARRMRHWL